MYGCVDSKIHFIIEAAKHSPDERIINYPIVKEQRVTNHSIENLETGYLLSNFFL